MSTIKDIQKLSSLLVADDISKLDAGAALHGRHSNISFKVVKVEDKAVTIQTTQGKHLSENYASQKDLIDRTRELFGKFVKGREIYVHAVAYVVPPTDVVTTQWIASQMNAKGVRIKDMVTLTGLDKTNLSAWINGKRDMSNIVKAMFYYFFASVKPPIDVLEAEYENVLKGIRNQLLSLKSTETSPSKDDRTRKRVSSDEFKKSIVNRQAKKIK